MHDSSIFKIRIDFEKSHDSYIFDKNTEEYFLDFFGMYSSLPLGYSHRIFKSPDFRKEYSRIAPIKVPNCEIISDEAQEFLREFSGCKEMSGYKHFHFCCTGALGIEAAIKTAIDQKRTKTPRVISLKESFHGINSYGGFATDRFSPVNTRLEGFPGMGWRKIHNPKIIYKDNKIDEKSTQKGLDKFIDEFNSCIREYVAKNIVALLIEPVQSTCGDNYFPESFFKIIRKLCSKYNICLIFDEIQTGFGTTGKMWYFQYPGIEPDIVVFGKKVQVSGIMVKEKYARIFKTPVRLEVTWDGDLIDMVRSKYILRAYKKYRILSNVRERNRQLVEGLKNIEKVENVRAVGLLVAFDFKTKNARDAFFHNAFSNRFLCNKTRDKTIRFRPNLNLSYEEVKEALRIVKKSLK